jgi:arylsulfatase A
MTAKILMAKLMRDTVKHISLKSTMKSRKFLLVILSYVMSVICLSAQELPNIIIIYADDLGYGDLSCYNDKSAYKTPNLDKMAKEGVRFTDAHSPSTICSPSRYGLFSGQLIYRSTGRGGVAFEGPGGPSYLQPGTLTIAEMLRATGYRTGVFGKWHVGLTWFDKNNKQLGGGFENSMLIDYEKSTPLIDGPNKRGFDESFITPNCPNTDPLYVYIENGMVPVPASMRHKTSKLPDPDNKWLWDNDEGWMSPGYDFQNADLLFYEKTREFITAHRKNKPGKPFFAVFSTQIAHAPVLPAKEFIGQTNAGPRGDFVWELDVLVGRIFNLVVELGIDENTLIIFNSDNGAETVHVDWMLEDYRHDASGGWRGMKRDGWEGGHRVPLIVRWPKIFVEGSVSDQLINTTDIFATLASLVGYSLKDEDARDSYDMLPAMLGTQKKSESIRPYLLTQSFRGEFQIRQGDWKYLDHKGSGGNNYEDDELKKYRLPETAIGATGQLYNLANDPGEKINLFFSENDKRRELQQLITLSKSNGRSAPRNRIPLGIKRVKELGRQNKDSGLANR